MWASRAWRLSARSPGPCPPLSRYSALSRAFTSRGRFEHTAKVASIYDDEGHQGSPTPLSSSSSSHTAYPSHPQAGMAPPDTHSFSSTPPLRDTEWRKDETDAVYQSKVKDIEDGISEEGIDATAQAFVSIEGAVPQPSDDGEHTPPKRERRRHRITQAQAMKEFLLTKRDLASLRPLKQKLHAVDLNTTLGTHVVYDLNNVRTAVAAKWGRIEELEAEKRRREELRRSLDSQQSPIFRWLYTDVRKASKQETRTQRLVILALIGNGCLAGSKLGAYFVTGSGSLLAEGVHSGADLLNQCMLLLGLTASRRNDNAMYPYGHAPERYLFALMSATGVFLLGGLGTIYHGIDLYLHPVLPDMEYARYGLGVLAFAGCVEGFTATVAFRTVRQKAKEANMGFREYILNGRDSIALAVLLEDSAAVTGCLLAMSCFGASLYTGNPVFDAVGTIGVGTLMSSVALFLIRKNRSALIGVAMPEEKLQRILEMLKADPVIREVHEVKAVMTDVENARFKAEIYFDGAEISRRYLESRPEYLVELCDALKESHTGRPGVHSHDVGSVQEILEDHGEAVVEAVGDEIDRLEDKIRSMAPEITHVDIEVL